MLRRHPARTAIALALVAALVLRGLLDLLLPDLETWIKAVATGLTAGGLWTVADHRLRAQRSTTVPRPR